MKTQKKLNTIKLLFFGIILVGAIMVMTDKHISSTNEVQNTLAESEIINGANSGNDSSLVNNDNDSDSDTNLVNMDNSRNTSSDYLIDCITSNEKDKVIEIIEENKALINQADSDGVYPLEATLVFNNLEIAELLLNNGAATNVVTQNGETIKDLALSGESKMMKVLFSNY